MDYIDEIQRIACCHLADLTGAQIDIFSEQFKEMPISALTMFYDKDQDLLTLNKDNPLYETYRRFVPVYMEASSEKIEWIKTKPWSENIQRIIKYLDGIRERRRIKAELTILGLQPIGDFVSLKRMLEAIQDRHAKHGDVWTLYEAYTYGLIQGKRTERARRKNKRQQATA